MTRRHEGQPNNSRANLHVPGGWKITLEPIPPGAPPIEGSFCKIHRHDPARHILYLNRTLLVALPPALLFTVTLTGLVGQENLPTYLVPFFVRVPIKVSVEVTKA